MNIYLLMGTAAQSYGLATRANLKKKLAHTSEKGIIPFLITFNFFLGKLGKFFTLSTFPLSIFGIGKIPIYFGALQAKFLGHNWATNDVMVHWLRHQTHMME